MREKGRPTTAQMLLAARSFEAIVSPREAPVPAAIPSTATAVAAANYPDETFAGGFTKAG